MCFSVLQVNLAWENLDKTWKERVERLEEAMQAAVQFQDGLQVLPHAALVYCLWVPMAVCRQHPVKEGMECMKRPSHSTLTHVFAVLFIWKDYFTGYTIKKALVSLEKKSFP